MYRFTFTYRFPNDVAIGLSRVWSWNARTNCDALRVFRLIYPNGDILTISPSKIS